MYGFCSVIMVKSEHKYIFLLIWLKEKMFFFSSKSCASHSHHMHWENYVSNSFHIECDMIVVTVFFSILNQMEFHLVQIDRFDSIERKVFLSILNQMELHLIQNRKENCHHDHIPFNLKGNGILVLSVRNAFL